MRVYVLDTSVVIRLYVPDGPLPVEAEPALRAAGRGDSLLISPELALVEAGQVLLKKEKAGFLTAQEAARILELILNLPIQWKGHRDYLALAVALAKERSMTVYDALFVVLALGHSATLLTADRAMQTAWESASTLDPSGD